MSIVSRYVNLFITFCHIIFNFILPNILVYFIFNINFLSVTSSHEFDFQVVQEEILEGFTWIYRGCRKKKSHTAGAHIICQGKGSTSDLLF